MKLTFVLSLLVFVFACSGEQKPGELRIEDEVFIPGERIDGPANMRSEPNGTLLFELENDVVVDVANFQKDSNWYRVGLFFQLTDEQVEKAHLSEGDLLYSVQGVQIGTAKADLYPLMMNEDNLGYIEGTTHIGNIIPDSFIERQLEGEIADSGRPKNLLWNFCEKYGFEATDQFEGYDSYFYYENFATDPSPGFRILLLFQDDLLQGIYHSRPLEIPGGQRHEIPYFGNHVTFFDNVPTEQQLNFVAYMYEWLQGVD